MTDRFAQLSGADRGRDVEMVPPERLAKRFANGYRFLAITILNTLIVFTVINLGLFAIASIRDYLYPDANAVHQRSAVRSTADGRFARDGTPIQNGRRTTYQLDWFDYGAYDGIPANYASEVLDDFSALADRGFIYQPWVQFAEPPFNGRRVNVDVDARGFPVRRTVNPPNTDALPVVTIFTLGGSTTFGYNVSDEHTWPSYLSAALNRKARADNLRVHVEVVNYGRGFFNPSQEAVLLMDLLKNGHRPNMVIFMDGVNHGTFPNYLDVPFFTERISIGMRNLQTPQAALAPSLEWLPVFRLARFARRVASPAAQQEPRSSRSTEQLIAYNVNFFQQNRRIAAAISELYATPAVFFLQPNAHYNYPLELFRRSVPTTFLRDRDVVTGLYGRLQSETGRRYLGDLFEQWGRQRKAIVDNVHYNPGFNEFLAQHVAEEIDVKAMKPHAPLDDADATGPPRSLPHEATAPRVAPRLER